MKRNVINITLFFTLFTFCSAGKTAQVPHSSDWTLSMLRGLWEYHTFEDKWTLIFQSDHNLIINNNYAQYMLLDESIRVISGNDSTDYQFTLEAATSHCGCPTVPNERTRGPVTAKRNKR